MTQSDRKLPEEFEAKRRTWLASVESVVSLSVEAYNVSFPHDDSAFRRGALERLVDGCLDSVRPRPEMKRDPEWLRAAAGDLPRARLRVTVITYESGITDSTYEMLGSPDDDYADHSERVLLERAQFLLAAALLEDGLREAS